MQGMASYTQAARERAMKVQEVMLQAMSKKISWWQAAEILGITDRPESPNFLPNFSPEPRYRK
jgi:hypothetical protein